MAMVMLAVIVGLTGLGVIGAGLVVLHHLMKKREQQVTMEAIKTTVIPELEQMTNRMLVNSMDVVMDKSVEMTKKMMMAQYE